MEKKKFTLKREIDTTDLIKSSITIVGAILAFVFITSLQLQNETAQIKIKLVEFIPSLSPSVQTLYENRISEDNKELKIRMYLKVISPVPLYYFPPKVLVIKSDNSDTLTQNQILFENLDSYSGIFPSGSEYNIQYNGTILDSNIDLVDYQIHLQYDIAVEEKIKNTYKVLFEEYMDSDYGARIDTITYKKQKYIEDIHRSNDKFEKIFKRSFTAS